MSRQMLLRWRLFLTAACFGVTTVAATSVFAQVEILDVLKSKVTSASQLDPLPPDVDAKRDKAAARLRVAQRELDSARAVGQLSAAPLEDRVEEVAVRDQVERVLAQQQDAQRRSKELKATLSETNRKLGEARDHPTDSAPSGSFLLLDESRDNLDSELKREESVRAAVAAATEALERAKSTAEEKERRRLVAKDAVSTNKDLVKAPELAQALAAAILEGELANELLALRRMELKNEKLAEESYRRNITLLRERVERLTHIARFDEQDLKAQTESIERQSADLKRELLLAEPDAAFLEDRWFDARRRAEADAEKSPRLTEEVEARRLAYLAQQQRIAVDNAQIRRLAEMRTAWNRRFKVAHQSADKPTIANWIDETQQTIEQLESEARVQAQKSADVRKKLAVLAGNTQKDAADDPGLTAWIDGQRQSLQQLSQTYETNLVGIEASRRLQEKLLAEMRGDAAPSVTSRLTSIGQWLVDAWNYPVATFEDRPITVRKIVIGMVMLILGIFASRLLSRMFGRRLLTRVGVHASASSAIQTVTYYVLLVFFALFALHVANVPLTTLTILGGAAALGIGFGSQNIINNFISGLILLAERPIRVGDLIEVDGLIAVVETIGARSTRVKTGANLEMIVPNSKFLENNVTNWTLSDSTVRCNIRVGVVYGSPTKQVAELLVRAAKLHETVMVDPEPFVWFLDFADNSLNFQVNFWIQMVSLSRRLTIESQIRFTIDDLFRDAGIIIAFPQRDVHLDVTRPLDIRMLPPDPSNSSPDGRAAA